METALQREKNAEYVWDDAVDQMVGYLRSKDAMMRTSSEYEDFGRNMIKKYPCFKSTGYKKMDVILFISNHQKVLVGLFSKISSF